VLLAAPCTGPDKQVVPEKRNAMSLRALPNMIAYPSGSVGFGTPYGHGDPGLWPGDKPTHCDDLARQNVTALKQVGFISHIETDETASLGSVGDPQGPVRVFTAIRTPPGHYRVMVVEPYEGCFVVYPPMP
jgi:hypothetical protein